MENLKQNAMMEEAIASAEISMNIPDTEKDPIIGGDIGSGDMDTYVKGHVEDGVLHITGVETTPDTELKEWFEANYLDGDKVQEGQMLASSECLDALSSRDTYWKEREQALIRDFAGLDPAERHDKAIRIKII